MTTKNIVLKDSQGNEKHPKTNTQQVLDENNATVTELFSEQNQQFKNINCVDLKDGFAISQMGSLLPSDMYRYTELIPVEKGDIVVYSGYCFGNSRCLAAYKNDGVFLRLILSETYKYYRGEKYIVEDDVFYVRACSRNTLPNGNDVFFMLGVNKQASIISHISDIETSIEQINGTDAIRDQNISSLTRNSIVIKNKTDIIDKESVKKIYHYIVEQGTIDRDGKELSATNRLRTKTQFRVYKDLLTVHIGFCGLGFKYRIFEFNSDGLLKNEEHSEDCDYILQSVDNYIRFVFIKSDDSNITVEDFNNIKFDFGTLVTDQISYDNVIADLIDTGDILNYNIIDINLHAHRKNDILNIIQGSITGSGQETPDVSRIKTQSKLYCDPENPSFYAEITNPLYKFRVFEFNAEGLFAWNEYTDKCNYTLSEANNYVRFVFMLVAGGQITPDEYDSIGFTYLGLKSENQNIDDSIKDYVHNEINQVNAKVLTNTSDIAELNTSTYKEEYKVEVMQGSINASGIELADEKRIKTISEFRPINGRLEISVSIINAEYGFRIAEYKSDGSFLMTLHDNDLNCDYHLNDGNSYLRFVFLRRDKGAISPNDFEQIGFAFNGLETNAKIVDKRIREYVLSTVGDAGLDGEKVAFLGDSVTASGSPTDQSNLYPNVFSRLSGCKVVNLGKWNTTIASDIINDPSALGNHFSTRATAENLQGCALVIVKGCINDLVKDKQPIGDLFVETTLPDGRKLLSAPEGNANFAAAVHDLINTIRTNAPDAKILFITPMMGVRGQEDRARKSNIHGEYLQDYRNAIKKICEFYSIPVFDLGAINQMDATNSYLNTKYFADGLHPNDLGHIAIANLLYRFVVNNIYIDR